MDPVAASQVATFLQASGPWGLVAALISVVVFLYRRTITLQDKLTELHEERVKDVAELAASTATGLTTSSSAIAAQTLASGSTNNLLQQILDVARPLAPALQVLSQQVDGNAQRLDGLSRDVNRGGRS